MSNENTSLAVVEPQGFDARQVEIIRNQIAKGASSDELALFLEVCKLTGLNPFMRQIYAIKRGGQMTIQTGIDGYRLVAARTGQLAGIDDPVYDAEDAEHPNRASVTVWRMVSGQRVPFTATARWREYSQQGGLWSKMPYLMLGKCAEALALRKAFPAELSGVYTGEEMQQADADYPPYVEARPAAHAEPTPIQRERPTPAAPMAASASGLGPTPQQMRAIKDLCDKLGEPLPTGLTAQNAGKTIFELNKRLRERRTPSPSVEGTDFEFTVDAPDDEGEIPADALKRVPVGKIGA